MKHNNIGSEIQYLLGSITDACNEDFWYRSLEKHFNS